jgi:hypothetical protein
MRKLLLAIIAVIAVSTAIAAPVFAGGDQVRGENGLGAVVQVQVQDPPPFQP